MPAEVQLVTGQKAAQPLIQLVEPPPAEPTKLEEDPLQNSGKKSKKTKQQKKAPPE